MAGPVIDALDRLAAALDRQTTWDREKDATRREERAADQRHAVAMQELAQRQTEQLAALNAHNAQLIARRDAWEAVEREHMKVCERKFHEQLKDQAHAPESVN